MKRLLYLTTFASVLIASCQHEQIQPQVRDGGSLVPGQCVEFDELTAGSLVTELFTPEGLGQFYNAEPLYNVLVVSGSGDPARPTSADQVGVRMDFDFSAIGPVTMHRMRFINVADDSRSPEVRLLDADGETLLVMPIPFTDENGVVALNFDSVENVASAVLQLDGDIALADMCFTPAPQPVDLGCTRTIGYWKNHSGVRGRDDISEHLPIYLGYQGAAATIAVTTNNIAYEILSQDQFGSASNGITKLYAQLLATKLNIAAGADDAPLGMNIRIADQFLSQNSFQDWGELSPAVKKDILELKDLFDRYNNGLEGVPHCD